MKLGIVGGKLQGMEAAYLAKKAGMEVVVVDRRADAPALSLADHGIVMDTIKDDKAAAKVFADCDAVLPANEDLATLTHLVRLFKDLKVPLIFDMSAYQVSSSKVRSNDLMRRLKVPMPSSWPECGFPAVVKPSGGSGSAGVTCAHNNGELEAGKERIRRMGDECVVQEFVDGPSISIEVIGNGEEFVPLVTTQIYLDDAYDCKMVRSPWVDRDMRVEEEFAEASLRIASELRVRGIMDVEAIVCKRMPKILEIDARIPSQTPAAVLASHGINMVQMLAEVFVKGNLPKPSVRGGGAAVYEHFVVEGRAMRSCGEGGFADVRNPRLVPGLFGSDEMITDYRPGKGTWRATMICSGSTPAQAWDKRMKALRNIIDENNITQYIDPEPEGYT
mgnify:CR=1 FL=1